MDNFCAEVSANGGGKELCSIGDHVFDEAQNAVEVSLYRALTQFERELAQEKKSGGCSDLDGCRRRFDV